MNVNKLNINFLVDKQTLKRIDNNDIISSSVNYLNATFKFTEDWKGTKKQVYLRNRYGFCQLYELSESNTLIIPSEFIIRKGFMIAIKGTIDDTIVITTSELVVDIVDTVDFDETLKEWLLSSTLSLSREGTTYTIDIPESVISYDEDSDTIHLKKLDGSDLTHIELPHKTRIDSLEGWTYTIDNEIEDETTNRESLAGHSIKVSQTKEHIIDVDLINANNESISHQEINLDTEHIIDNVYLDYTNKKLIFIFKDGHKLEVDLTEMIKDYKDELVKVNTRIDALDYYNSKSEGEYIDGITQTGGLVSVTKKSFDISLDDTSINAPQSKVVKSYVDEETTRAIKREDELEKSISSSGSDITSRLNSEILRANMSEAQIQAKLDIEVRRATEVEDEINSKISPQASSTNQLADKDFVNSSIATATATFRGTVSTISELKTLSGDLNDYAFVRVIDTTTGLVKQFDKYKYTTTASAETGNWVYEYTLNNSSFTDTQWKAITSGITSDLVTQISTNKTNITNEIVDRQVADKSLQNQIESLLPKTPEFDKDINYILGLRPNENNDGYVLDWVTSYDSTWIELADYNKSQVYSSDNEIVMVLK